MRKRNRKFIDTINYSENEMAKEILKDVKRSNIIFYLIFILETLTYIFLAVYIINVKLLFIISILYLIVSLDLGASQKKYINKRMKEAINITICPEAFLNINLYNMKRIMCSERLYNYSLNNIAYAYIQLGELDKATDIIKYLDTRKKDLLLQSEIINNKIDIFFLKKDIKNFNKECDNLKKILRFIPKKRKNKLTLSLKLKQAVAENNILEVNRLCDLLEKKKCVFNKVQASYYRGLLQENKGKNNFEEYYKYVAEYGNNIMIAKEVRNKLNIKDINFKYKKKLHIGYKIFQFILLAVFLSSTIFWNIYTLYIFSL